MRVLQKLDTTKYWNQVVAAENKKYRETQSRQSVNSFKLFLVAFAIILFIMKWELWLPAIRQWAGV